MKELLTRSPAETEAFGERVGRAAAAGEVYGLDGDLGAGKTAFVRGFARGVGSVARVHSPTFALLHEYAGGRLTVHHLDLHRLGSADDLAAAGLDAVMSRPEGVAVVEWFSRADAAGAWPQARRLRFEWIDAETRRITHDLPNL